MASSRLPIIKVCNFLLTKYPVLNALSFLMLLAERAKNESEPPFHPYLIYGHVGVILLCGFLMTTQTAKKQATLVLTGQLTVFALVFYQNKRLGYGQWQRIHMATRQAGCIGVYTLFASLCNNRDRQPGQLRRIGEIVIGIYLFAYAYTLNSSNEYKKAFLYHFLESDWLRYFVTLAIVACALCFMSSYFLRDVTICAAAMLFLVTVVMDLDFQYWTGRGVHYWNQVRLVLDSSCAIIGFVLFSQVFKNRITSEHFD